MFRKTILLVAGILLFASPALAQDEAEVRDILERLQAPVAMAPQLAPQGGGGSPRAEALTAFKQRDLTGIWHMHIWLNGSFGFWTQCTVKIRANGSVAAGGKCKLYDTFDDEIVPTKTSGGKYAITKAGKISGKLIVGSLSLPVSDAWMQRSKDFFQGVGVAGSLPSEFTAVKR